MEAAAHAHLPNLASGVRAFSNVHPGITDLKKDLAIEIWEPAWENLA